MLVSERNWTDRRDGRTWIVRGVWLSDDVVMGPVEFRCGGVVYDCRCGVTLAADKKLEGLLDHARRSVSVDG